MADRSSRLTSPAGLAAIVALVAIAMLLPDLGAHGLWSDAELPMLDRVRAALGASLSDLERAPWLPELLRTRAYAMLPSEAGLRLPHAIAAVSLVAMACGLARARGASPRLSLLAGALALAFPMLSVAGRTALGDPIGEAFAAGTVLAGLAALRPQSLVRAIAWSLLAALLLAAAVASSGLALGGALPVGALAAAASLQTPSRRSTRIAAALWLAFLAAAGVAVMLSLRQGDGYIPVLGAAKDLVLIDKPEDRRFAAGVETLGHALYPWAPLVIAGALLGRRDRMPALWLGLGVTIASGWTLVYGLQPLPLTVPAALCGTAAVEWMLDPRTDRTGRRAALMVVVLGMLVIGKDTERTPSAIAVPQFDFEGERGFPEEETHAPERLQHIGSLALWSLLAVGLLAPSGAGSRRPPHRLDRLLDRLPAGPRSRAPVVLVAAAALLGAHEHARGLLPEICDHLSPRRLLEHHRVLAEAGELPTQLGNHRVRDPALEYYGPGDITVLASRRELSAYLSEDAPRVAIIRSRDLPALHQDHRQRGWPLFVLDDRHAILRLVSNRLPAGEEDRNPIPKVVLDQPPQLAHPTLLRFETYIEIVGWEVTEPVVRGRPATIQLAIKVLRPLPGGSKLYARLLKGRSSRINGDPHELTDGVYPPNLWREGDYILHRFTFDTPTLEIQPGVHQLLVGLRRSERQNFEISLPAGSKGEFGVLVRGKSRHFAELGPVEVW